MVIKPKMLKLPKIHPKNSTTAEPAKEGEAAQAKGDLTKVWLKTIKAEERTRFLREMVKVGIGTNEVEDFVKKQRSHRFADGVGGNDDRKEVIYLMERKVEDSIKDEEVCRKKRGRLRTRLEKILCQRKNEYKGWVKSVRKKVLALRKCLKKKYKRKI